MRLPICKIQQALAYPHPIPEEAFFMAGDEAGHIVEFHSEEPLQSSVLLEGADTPEPLINIVKRKKLINPMDTDGFIPILASGGIASPGRLWRSFDEHRWNEIVIISVPGLTENLCSVYSAHISQMGSIPATLAPVEGANTSLFCTFLPVTLLERLHEEERLGSFYGFYQLDGITTHPPDGASIKAPYAYLSLHGCLSIDHSVVRLPHFPYDGPMLPSYDEKELMQWFIKQVGYTGSLMDFIAGSIEDDILHRARYEILQQRFRGKPVRGGFTRIA